MHALYLAAMIVLALTFFAGFCLAMWFRWYFNPHRGVRIPRD